MQDLFKSIVKEDKHSRIYRSIRDDDHQLPIKMMILEAFSSFENIDGNFIEQFQTTGFDARLFELYVWMCIKESGFNIDRSYKYPDFLVSKGIQKFAIEVTTATGGLPVDEKFITSPDDVDPFVSRDIYSDEFQRYMSNDVPLMFSSSILSKLRKQYWLTDHCKDIPFIIFIGGFFDDMASIYSSWPLISVLFGIEHANNEIGLPYGKFIESHDKSGVKIPSGVFNMPTDDWTDMKHVSAVAFSNGGTTAKFRRMGWYKGYYKTYNETIRSGICVNKSGTVPIEFEYSLSEPPVREKWNDEVILIKNPNALHPLPDKLFNAYSKVFIDDNGILQLTVPRDNMGVISSNTMVYGSNDIEITNPNIGRITKAEFDSYKRCSRSNSGLKEVNWFKSISGQKIGVLCMKEGISINFVYRVFTKGDGVAYKYCVESGEINNEGDAVDRLVEEMGGLTLS